MMCTKTLSILFLFFLHTKCTILNEELPNYIHVCHKSDPDLNECMLKSVEKLRPHLIKGIPELGIPSVDPIAVDELVLLDGPNSNGMSIKTKNLKVFDSGNFQLKKMEVIEYGKLYGFDVFFPKLRIIGDYNVNGQLLGLPIRGNGKFEANFTNSYGSVKLIGEKTTKNDEDYFHIKRFNLKTSAKRGFLHLDNLFGGDKFLGDIVNETINRNFDVILQELGPMIDKSVSKLLKKIANRIVSTYPYDILFPE